MIYHNFFYFFAFNTLIRRVQIFKFVKKSFKITIKTFIYQPKILKHNKKGELKQKVNSWKKRESHLIETHQAMNFSLIQTKKKTNRSLLSSIRGLERRLDKMGVVITSEIV
jgi:hypothetical protein